MFKSPHVWLQGLIYPSPPLLAVEMVRVLLRSIGRTHWGLILLFIVLVSFVDDNLVRLQVLALGATYYVGSAFNRRHLRKLLLEVDTADLDETELARRLNKTLGMYFLCYGFYGLCLACVPWVIHAPDSHVLMLTVTVLLLAFGFAQSIVLSALPAIPSACQTMVALSLAICWLTSRHPNADLQALAIIVFVTISLRGAWRMSQSLHETVRSRLQLDSTLFTMRAQAKALQSAIETNRNSEREKARMFSAANHDLRQPVSAASLYVGILIGRLEKIPEQFRPALRDSIEKIDAAILSVDSIISSMSELSKLEADQISPRPYRTDLRTIVLAVIEETSVKARQKSTAIHEQIPSLMLHTDPALLARLLRNLLDNCLTYASGHPVSIQLAERAGHPVLIIEDNGPGIPDAELETVFNPYVQLNNPERDRSKGLGLGLAVVRRFSEALRLRTWLEAREMRGLRVCIDLHHAAMAHADTQDHKTNDDIDPALINGKQVVMIDDDEDIRYAFGVLLADWGCIAHCFGTLSEALEHLNARHEAPDLILVDNRLPSTEGVNAARELRRLAPSSPVVLITGDTGAQVEERARQEGLPIVYKPISPEKLRKLIAHPTLV